MTHETPIAAAPPSGPSDGGEAPASELPATPSPNERAANAWLYETNPESLP